MAKINFPAGERPITVGDLRAWAESRRAANEQVRWPETFDDFAGRLLLADEATRHGMTEPADAVQRGEAWAKQEIMPAAEQSVTEADLQNGFSERRSAVRVMSRSEAEAKALKEALAEPLAQATDMASRVKVFKTRGGKTLDRANPRGDDETMAPVGALFDASGKGDQGQAVVPERIAQAAFALAADGDVSEPIEMAANRWVLVMRTGTRPGTPLDKVPPDVRERMKAGIVATRSMAAMKERVARLRRDNPVVMVDEMTAARALGLDEGAVRSAKMRRLPMDMKRQRFEALRGGPKERLPGIIPKDVPVPTEATPDKVQKGMQP